MAARRSVGRALTLVVLLPGLVLAGLTVGASGASAQKIRSDFWGMHDNDWVSAPTVPVGSANFTTSGTYWTDDRDDAAGISLRLVAAGRVRWRRRRPSARSR